MKKPVLWIIVILLALVFLFAVKQHDESTSENSVLTNTVNVVKKSANKVADKVEDGVEAAGDLAEDAADAVEDGVEAAGDLAEDAADAVEDGVEAAGDLAEDAADAVEDGVEAAGDLVEDAADAVEDVVEDTIEEVTAHDGYQLFSEDAVKNALADGKNVALFFHANRCPSCVALDEVIIEGEDGIDSNTLVFKVDYDSETELTEKYGVTSQHTVVYLDENMEATSLDTGINSLEDLTANF